MPKTVKDERVPVGLPKKLMDAIKILIEKYPALFPNRQQFVERAVREKIEQILELEKAKTLSVLASRERDPE